MKTAIIISGDIKQIMLTPENKPEEKVLELFELGDDISVLCKQGTLYDSIPQGLIGFTIDPCMGGYLRAFEDRNSLMLVLKPKEPKVTEVKSKTKIHWIEITTPATRPDVTLIEGLRYFIHEDGQLFTVHVPAPVLSPEEYKILNTFEEV